MKAVILASGILAALAATSASALAQNYPWCAYYSGSGGSRNCGFVSFQQCLATAQGAGADCRPNPQFEPRKGLH